METSTNYISFNAKNQSRLINSEVEITSLAFQRRSKEHGLKGYPKRMVWDGREYNFRELSMQYLVRKGQELVQLFDMTDGDTTYRLRNDGQQWTLVGLKSGW